MQSQRKRPENLRLINERISGTRIESTSFNLSSLLIRLSNGSVLKVSVDDCSVACQLLSLAEWEPQPVDIPELISLREVGHPVEVWSWQSLLQTRLGKEVRGLTASKEWLWLHQQEMPELLFIPYEIVPTKARLLTFSSEAL